jgi:hypothetical protein
LDFNQILTFLDWPTQSWYAKAMQMCQKPPARLGQGKKPAEIPRPTLGVAPPTQIAGASSLPLIRKQLITQGLSDGTIQIIMASWRQATGKQYQCYLLKWISFCQDNGIL